MPAEREVMGVSSSRGGALGRQQVGYLETCTGQGTMTPGAP